MRGGERGGREFEGDCFLCSSSVLMPLQVNSGVSHPARGGGIIGVGDADRARVN